MPPTADPSSNRSRSANGSEGLRRSSLAILDRNWLGHATRPGRQYPHQWSWDSATIAMGRARWDQERAEDELRSLFAGQWENGLVPHIIFTESEEYFPGASFWQSERARAAPTDKRTSGIVQPPIHATAAWRMYLKAPDRERARGFLAELMPSLDAWHRYLYRERTRGDGLTEIWHPWESGMDNSPAWDEALARIELTPEMVPVYERVDTRIGDPDGRPSDFDYDRYAYLVRMFRDLDYDQEAIREQSPFVVQPVLFNSLLIQADRDLASIAMTVGDDPARYVSWARQTETGLEKLWAEVHGVYLDYDVRVGETVAQPTIAGFAPLYAGVPSADRAERMLALLAQMRPPSARDMWAIPTVGFDAPQYQPTLYWRGPVWVIYQWVLWQGATRYGHDDLAGALRETTLRLAERNGIWEHYNPDTGGGQGDPDFSWTAGLLLDLLDPPEVDQGRTEDRDAIDLTSTNGKGLEA